jgi:tungstate transport system substrate-binding protein
MAQPWEDAMRHFWFLTLAVALALAAGCRAGVGNPTASVTKTAAIATRPANPKLILSTTTSTVDTGLLDYLLPIFEKQTGYSVTPLSLGSGQALATAARGEADVLLVHSPSAEQSFMAAGDGVDRRLVMHNDFVVIGPAADPAGLKNDKQAVDAFQRIATAKAPFVSRGDNSGTNAEELTLWKTANITPKGQSWYIESGTGMGETLNIANEKDAYTLSDRGTYLAQQKNLQLPILVEGDPALLNIYHVIRTNPSKSDKLNVEGAKAFEEFMVSPATQKLIADFGRDKYGQSLFFPDAGKSEDQVGK